MIRYFFLLLFLIFLNCVSSQNNEKNRDLSDLTFKERLFTGGNFGIQFGTITYIEIAPILGYRITNNFVAGVGATYIYFSDKTYQPKYTTDIYGGSIFGRYFVFENVFAHAELSALNYEAVSPFQNNSYVKERVWTNGVFLGGGYRQMLGDFSSVNIMILWNFNEEVNSPYQNPIIRMGFDIGL